MLKKPWALAAAALALLLVCALYFGPHWTVYRMRAAVQARDAQALSSYIDYPALRESVKTQLLQSLMPPAAAQEARGNPFAVLGQALATGLASPLVDALVSPTAVMLMLQQGEPAAAAPAVLLPPPPASALPPGAEPSATTQAPPRYAVHFVDYATARIQAGDGRPGGFILKRDGLFGWKLAGLDIAAPR